jgi:glycyl-tRNA synthetase beta chain
MTDFLFEIGLEEVPARMIAGAQAELERKVVGLLLRERLVAGEIEAKSFSTPRRLAVLVRGVKDRQEDLAEEMVGPSAKVAYKDGVATAAAVAFARKAGVEVAALKTVTTAKGEYLAATAMKAGRAAGVVIEEELPKEIAGIYWAKTMYWRAGKMERFVRPVRWLVAMLGSDTLEVEFAGQRSGRTTYGHRVLHGAEGIDLGAAAEYEGALARGFVVADVEVRRQKIRKELDRVCRTVPGARWREDHALVDKLTHLTEWPSVILGSFQAEYLELPEEVLVTVMRDHQSYFAVEDEGGALAAYFLAVLNTEADERGQGVIRHGNERVLRARFNDARFFWEFDQRTSLNDRVVLLDKVTFQKDLGSYGAKAERVRLVAAELSAVVAAGGGRVDAGALDESARLAKTDLTTELVKEFTELQGVVGGLYARAQGHAETVAAAIHDQYRPASMEDAVPRTVEGALLAIADKADTIAGMFGLGLEPTGSKDPFALRRAANGIVKILAETELPLRLGEICFMAARGRESVVKTMEIFFAERLEFFLREAHAQAYDVVKAVLAVGADDVRDALARAEAVTAVRGATSGTTGDFGAVSAAFKRMSNILAQAGENGFRAAGAVDPALFSDEAEKWLFDQAAGVAVRVGELRAGRNYKAALEAIAELRPQVDAFFEAVMVMSPDVAVRANRLALLEKVLGDFSGIADFSEIVVAG